MSETEGKCDLEYCNSEGDHNLSKYIFVCGIHWFLIMNGVKKISTSEMEYFRKLEKQRKESGNNERK